MSNITPTAWQTEVMDAFIAYWAPIHPDVQIASPNRPFDRSKVPEDTFVEWSLIGEAGGQTRYSNSTANNFFSRIGTMTWTANVKVQLKVELALDLINDIGLFYETVLLEDGYFTGVGTQVPLGDDGSWYQVSLSANWIYFTDRQSVLT